MTEHNTVFAPFSSAQKDSDLANKKDGDSEKFALLAGKNRYFYEALTGSAPGNETAMSQKNPQGLIGLDLSGPPFGRALRHSVWQVTGIQLTSGTWLNNVRSWAIKDPNEPLIVKCGFFNKPYPKIENTPHSKLFLSYRVLNSNASTTAISTKVTMGGRTFTTSSQNVSGSNTYSVLTWNSDGDGVSAYSGWNEGTLEIKSTQGSASNPVYIIMAALSNIKKSSH
jgi:hypothetical protein